MAIQIFGTKKCKDTQKAIRFFKERGFSMQFIDLNIKGPSKGELNSIASSVPLEKLIDTDGKEFKKGNYQYKHFNLENELLEKPFLLKTPIVRIDKKASVGYQPEIWKNLIS